MIKLYTVCLESNLAKDLTTALANRNYLIESQNGLWHLSKYGIPDGENKYACLEYMIACEEFFEKQFICFFWNSQKYIFREDTKRLVNYMREFIVEDNKKTRVLVFDAYDMRMKELSALVYRSVYDPDKLSKLPIRDRVEFPHGIQAFELEY